MAVICAKCPLSSLLLCDARDALGQLIQNNSSSSSQVVFLLIVSGREDVDWGGCSAAKRLCETWWWRHASSGREHSSPARLSQQSQGQLHGDPAWQIRKAFSICIPATTVWTEFIKDIYYTLLYIWNNLQSIRIHIHIPYALIAISRPASRRDGLRHTWGC